jgi:hypothetical protein
MITDPLLCALGAGPAGFSMHHHETNPTLTVSA